MIPTSGSDGSCVTPPAVVPKLPVSLDTKGRVRTSKEQRRLILAEFARSGMSAPQFARQTGLKYSTFAAWLHRYPPTRRPKAKSPQRWLEAVVASAPTPPALQVHLPGGARLELSQASQVPLVAALVRTLEQPC